MIIFGKVVGSLFGNNDYHVFRFRVSGGEFITATYRGDNPPPVRKSVQIAVRGEWQHHKKYGKQLCINEWERSDVKQVDYNHRSQRRFV